jgi:phage gpG-like protein
VTKDLTLLGAAEMFTTLGLEAEHHNHHALESAAKIVQRQAKAYIGTYDATYPTVWLPLAESTKKDRVSKGFPEDEPLLRTGAIRDSIKYQADHHEANIGTDLQIAVWHELGTSRFVPRPFLEPALKEKTPEILEKIGAIVVGHLSGEARETD